MKNSLHEHRSRHGLAALEYALLLLVVVALALGLWSRYGRQLLDAWGADADSGSEPARG